MSSVLVITIVQAVLCLLLLVVWVFWQRRQEQDRVLIREQLRDIAESLRAIADGRPSFEGHRPSKSFVGQNPPQLKVAELPPEAIAPWLKRPPKPPSGSGVSVSRTNE